MGYLKKKDLVSKKAQSGYIGISGMSHLKKYSKRDIFYCLVSYQRFIIYIPIELF